MQVPIEQRYEAPVAMPSTSAFALRGRPLKSCGMLYCHNSSPSVTRLLLAGGDRELAVSALEPDRSRPDRQACRKARRARADAIRASSTLRSARSSITPMASGGRESNTLIFSANHFPAARFGTQAYFERWLLIEFERCYRGSKRVDARLSASWELSGALSRARPALRRLRESNRFRQTVSVRRACAESEVGADPFRSWLETETVRVPSKSISQSLLHAEYASACLQANHEQMFARLIKKHTPDRREFQKIVDGTKQWIYGGIGLRDENSNHSILVFGVHCSCQWDTAWSGLEGKTPAKQDGKDLL